MTFMEYERSAMKTRNRNLSNTDVLTNAVMGMNGEAGECIDLVKKYLHQGHKLDVRHLAEECGDVLWYVTELAFALGYDLEEIAQMNIDKLRERYKNGGFDADKSINRTV